MRPKWYVKAVFTGLVAGIGQLRRSTRRGPGYRLSIACDTQAGFDALALGESIAVNGACLTVVDQTSTSFDADISLETAQKTTLGRLAPGTELNLERALRVGDRLGGHMLSGHVDDVARIESVAEQGDAWLVRVGFGAEQRRFVARKGSVALDGVSLTVNDVTELSLGVMLIPHTRQVTTLKHWRPGLEVNLEVDLAARYLVNYFETIGGEPADTAQKAQLMGDSRFALALERAGYK